MFIEKLNKQSNPNDFEEKFLDWVNNYEHKVTYRVQFGSSNLFLSGYNFTNKVTSEGKYPVFAPKNAKIYFDKQYAEGLCSEFNHMFSGVLKVV